MRPVQRILAFALSVLVAAPALSAAPAKPRKGFSPDEVKMGQEAAKEVERQSKLVTDEKTVSRIAGIGQALVKVSELPDAEFSFKVLDEKDVNAFALPGGFVYVFKGLIERAESDDEIAGVIAHEIVHATHHHTQKMIKKAKPYNLASIGALLATIFVGGDAAALAQGVNLLGTAAVNGYTVELETESDRDGMAMMLRSKYNPVGMLTFMERLAQQEARSGAGAIEMGIFRTHPYTPDRATAMRKTLEEKGIDINRRLVTRAPRVEAETVRVGESDAAVVKMSGAPIVTLGADGDVSALDRARSAADELNRLLDANLGQREVRAGADGSSVLARNSTVINITEADATLAGKPRAEVAADAANAIRRTLWNEYLRWNT